jgi:hypothetical protein
VPRKLRTWGPGVTTADGLLAYCCAGLMTDHGGFTFDGLHGVVGQEAVPLLLLQGTRVANRWD